MANTADVFYAYKKLLGVGILYSYFQSKDWMPLNDRWYKYCPSFILLLVQFLKIKFRP
jgi:hypothetical protein